jgi:hypothetical protein
MSVQTTYATNMSAAFAGMRASNNPGDVIIPMRNNEASAEIAFGRAVKYEGSTDDDGALLPTAETSKIAGIVMHRHGYTVGSNGELGTTGLKPGAIMEVMKKGELWVTVEDAVVPGDRLWVRAVAGGDPEFLGGLLPADDSTDTVDCTAFGEFQTTAAAGGLARLRIDFI